MQSYEGIIRLFPNWNRNEDASFFGLRAYGAFIVDADLKSGIVNAVIYSEKGGALTIEKPSDGDYAVIKEGLTIPFEGREITLDTHMDERIIIKCIGKK